MAGRRTLEEGLPGRWTGADNEVAVLVQWQPREASRRQRHTDSDVQARVRAQVDAYLSRFPPFGVFYTAEQIGRAIAWINHDYGVTADSPGSMSVMLQRPALLGYLAKCGDRPMPCLLADGEPTVHLPGCHRHRPALEGGPRWAATETR